MTIEVTPEDIRMGKRNMLCSCPVALAIKRATGAERVAVGGTDALWVSDNEPLKVNLPIEARSFIFAFDEGGQVTPFTFDLEVPS